MTGTGMLVHQRHGIVLWLVEERGLLDLIGRQMDVDVVSMCDFGHPLSNELTLWIQLLALLNGIVDAQFI